MRSAGTGFGLLITSLIIMDLVVAEIFVVAAESMTISCDKDHFAIAARAAIVCELMYAYTVATINHATTVAIAFWYAWLQHPSGVLVRKEAVCKVYAFLCLQYAC